MEQTADWVALWPLGSGTTIVLGAVTALLVVGTLVRGARAMLRPDDSLLRERLRSVGAWWVLFALFVVVLLVGPRGILMGMAVLSIFLLRETLRLADRSAWYPVAVVAALLAFLFLWLDGTGFLTRLFPLLGIGLLLTEGLWRRRQGGRKPPLVPAVLIGIAGPLYAAGIGKLPALSLWMGGPLGWFALLAVLTELNDSAQAWWGRAIGAHGMTPTLSPGKTWEGLAGGILTLTAVALIVAPLLTPYGRTWPPGMTVPAPPWLGSVGIAVAIGLSGILGDLAGSWLKRQAGVKDSGDLIPGQGGLLDRLDSLALTAPLFYLTTHWLWF